MPHIHTEPGQHDITVSAYIVRTDEEEPLCLVHMHRKIGKLMQIGGHIELTETPWQSLAHELVEESGYSLDELQVVQHTADRVMEVASINHPTPFCVNTHSVGNGHFHSDLCYGFVANAPAKNAPAEGESADIRWLTISEMEAAVQKNEALEDMMQIYKYLVRHLGTYALVAATDFSLEKPARAIATYRYGAPGVPAKGV